MESFQSKTFKTRLLAISFSFLIGILLMGLKFYVYWLTDSLAVLSDALESIINVVASAFALGSIILSAKPPDPSHPYGHGKIEYFSAGFEGALIVLAAFGIVWTAVPQILTPHQLPNLQSGLFILLGTSAVNLAVGMTLVHFGKKTKSLVLKADGKHILSDVYTSAGVLFGLFLVHKTGWYWADGVIALCVAINILVIGSQLIKESFAGLMDASDPELLKEISDLLAEHRKSTWIDIHRLRAFRSGNAIHVDLHLILPRDLTLEQAHKEVSEVQKLLNRHLDGMAETLVHAEPCIDPECPVCGYDPCDLRQTPLERQTDWDKEMLTAPAPEESRNGVKPATNRQPK